MKRTILIFIVLVSVVSVFGCLGSVHHVKSGGNPDAEDWRKILIKNDSSLYVEYHEFGNTYLLDPWAEKIHVVNRFRELKIMIYAYRRTNQGAFWFVGQKEITLKIEGRIRKYKGRRFADYKILRERGWRRTSFGYPTKHSGTIPILRIPWELNIKTKSPRGRPRH